MGWGGGGGGVRVVARARGGAAMAEMAELAELAELAESAGDVMAARALGGDGGAAAAAEGEGLAGEPSLAELLFASDEVAAALGATRNATALWTKALAPVAARLARHAATGAAGATRYAAAWWAHASMRERLAAAGALVLLAALVYLNRLFARRRYLSRLRAACAARWQRASRGLGRRGRAAAALLPHLLFAACAWALWVPAGDLAAGRPALAALVTVAVPTVAAIRAERRHGAVAAASRRRALELVVAFASLHAVQRAPLVGALARALIARFPQTLLLFALWAILPLADGAAATAAALTSLANANPATAVLGRGGRPASVLERSLTRMLSTPIDVLMLLGVVRRGTKERALAVLTDRGNASLMALPALMTPAMIVRPAALFAGVVLPLHATLAALTTERAFSNRGGEYAALAAEESRHWLRYWVVLAGALSFKLFAEEWGALYMPLWEHANLLLLMWLQLPYFHGADRLYLHSGTSMTAFGARARDRVGELRREAARAREEQQRRQLEEQARAQRDERARLERDAHQRQLRERETQRTLQRQREVAERNTRRVSGPSPTTEARRTSAVPTDSELLEAYEAAMEEHQLEGWQRSQRGSQHSPQEWAIGGASGRRAMNGSSRGGRHRLQQQDPPREGGQTQVSPPLSPTPLSPAGTDVDEPAEHAGYADGAGRSPTADTGSIRRRRKLPGRRGGR